MIWNKRKTEKFARYQEWLKKRLAVFPGAPFRQGGALSAFLRQLIDGAQQKDARLGFKNMLQGVLYFFFGMPGFTCVDKIIRLDENLIIYAIGSTRRMMMAHEVGDTANRLLRKAGIL